jgi:hypothetical protein
MCSPGLSTRGLPSSTKTLCVSRSRWYCSDRTDGSRPSKVGGYWVRRHLPGCFWFEAALGVPLGHVFGTGAPDMEGPAASGGTGTVLGRSSTV